MYETAKYLLVVSALVQPMGRRTITGAVSPGGPSRGGPVGSLGHCWRQGQAASAEASSPPVPLGGVAVAHPNMDARIEASLNLTDAALEKGVRAGDLAGRLGLSRSRFEHLFKAQTGAALRLYVSAARLARAKTLLRDPRLRAKEVAFRCGYEHTSSLDREFRREFSLSPSEFRRSASG